MTRREIGIFVFLARTQSLPGGAAPCHRRRRAAPTPIFARDGENRPVRFGPAGYVSFRW